jgi:uncharacterized membrane protein YdbT with pleckstrin-like domain
MASYIEGALTPGEQLLHTAHVSLWSLWVPLLIGAILLPAFGLGLIAWGYAYVQYKTTEVAVTSKRVIVKRGFISRQTVEINIQRIESVQVDQTVMGRMLGFGSLVLAGGGTPQAPILGISEPLAFRRAFMAAQEVALNARPVKAE